MSTRKLSVTLRSGKTDDVNLDKIQDHVASLSNNLNVDPFYITQRVNAKMTDGITVHNINMMAADVAEEKGGADYKLLAMRLRVAEEEHTEHTGEVRQHYVVMRDGTQSIVRFDKIRKHVSRLAYGLDVDPGLVTQHTTLNMVDGMTVSELNYNAASVAATLCNTHPDYGLLGGRLYMSELHHQTPDTFRECHRRTRHYMNDRYNKIVDDNIDEIEAAIVNDRDFDMDYFGAQTAIKKYSIQNASGEVVERLQYMYMRVALANSGEYGWKNSYDLLSTRQISHATPTAINSGTLSNQKSSCFLQEVGDSIASMYQVISDSAHTSKFSGGIGTFLGHIRSANSYIRGVRGRTRGIAPYMKVNESTAIHVNQGGRRPGSIAVYLPAWHADIEMFLKMRLPDGTESNRTRQLYTGVCYPSLMFTRGRDGRMFSLFDPGMLVTFERAMDYLTTYTSDRAPYTGYPEDTPKETIAVAIANGDVECDLPKEEMERECMLNNLWGPEFDACYERYERLGLANKKVHPVNDILNSAAISRGATGMPYEFFTDNVNRCNNQSNEGMVRMSNLCTEIMEVSRPGKMATCNLASVVLPKFVRDDFTFDFDALKHAVRTCVQNINVVIDTNLYALDSAKYYNFRMRPMAIGVIGLSDVFQMCGMPFDCQESAELDYQIFECMYYTYLDESCRLAETHGHYEGYAGSPLSEGRLHPDMWGTVVKDSERCDWTSLRARIAQFGVYNSLGIGLMPTATTGQVAGHSTSFEIPVGCIHLRRTDAGMFDVSNQYLARDLSAAGIDVRKMSKKVLANGGSVRGISEVMRLKSRLGYSLEDVYQTAFEVPGAVQLRRRAMREAFVDQGASGNVFFNSDKLYTNTIVSATILAHDLGLKTVYYLRGEAETNADIAEYAKQSALMSSEKNDDDVANLDAVPECVWKPNMAPEDCAACGT